MANKKSPNTTNIQISTEANERLDQISEETKLSKVEVASQLVLWAAGNADAVLTTKEIKFTKRASGKPAGKK